MPSKIIHNFLLLICLCLSFECLAQEKGHVELLGDVRNVSGETLSGTLYIHTQNFDDTVAIEKNGLIKVSFPFVGSVRLLFESPTYTAYTVEMKVGVGKEDSSYVLRSDLHIILLKEGEPIPISKPVYLYSYHYVEKEETRVLGKNIQKTKTSSKSKATENKQEIIEEPKSTVKPEPLQSMEQEKSIPPKKTEKADSTNRAKLQLQQQAAEKALILRKKLQEEARRDSIRKIQSAKQKADSISQVRLQLQQQAAAKALILRKRLREEARMDLIRKIQSAKQKADSIAKIRLQLQQQAAAKALILRKKLHEEAKMDSIRKVQNAKQKADSIAQVRLQLQQQAAAKALILRKRLREEARMDSIRKIQSAKQKADSIAQVRLQLQQRTAAKNLLDHKKLQEENRRDSQKKIIVKSTEIIPKQPSETPIKSEESFNRSRDKELEKMKKITDSLSAVFQKPKKEETVILAKSSEKVRTVNKEISKPTKDQKKEAEKSSREQREIRAEREREENMRLREEAEFEKFLAEDTKIRQREKDKYTKDSLERAKKYAQEKAMSKERREMIKKEEAKRRSEYFFKLDNDKMQNAKSRLGKMVQEEVKSIQQDLSSSRFSFICDTLKQERKTIYRVKTEENKRIFYYIKIVYEWGGIFCFENSNYEFLRDITPQAWDEVVEKVKLKSKR